MGEEKVPQSGARRGSALTSEDEASMDQISPQPSKARVAAFPPRDEHVRTGADARPVGGNVRGIPSDISSGIAGEDRATHTEPGRVTGRCGVEGEKSPWQRLGPRRLRCGELEGQNAVDSGNVTRALASSLPRAFLVYSPRPWRARILGASSPDDGRLPH